MTNTSLYHYRDVVQSVYDGQEPTSESPRTTSVEACKTDSKRYRANALLTDRLSFNKALLDRRGSYSRAALPYKNTALPSETQLFIFTIKNKGLQMSMREKFEDHSYESGA